LAVDLHNQFPMLVGALVGLSFLSLALLAIFTRDLYRSFKGLFEAYNAPAETVAPDAANGSPAEAPPDQTAPPNPPSPPDQTDQPATP
jgi:hypothetical protein